MIKRTGVVIDPMELDEAWARRVENSGINVVGLHPDPRDSDTERIRVWLQDEDTVSLLRRLTEQGVDIEWEVHALSWLLPREHFRTNPMWFRMDESGERTADHNLCCSSEEALETIRVNAAELAHWMVPTNHRYHLWLDDAACSRCHCSRCEALSPADQALKVYNAILTGLRRTDPLAKQCFLAYHDTNGVPERILPEPGIYLEYAPFDRDHRKALCDTDCEKNIRETSALPALLERFGREDAQVLDYWLDNSLFSGWIKPPRKFQMERDVFRADVKYYLQMGFETVTSFACYLGEEYTALYPEPEDPVFYGKVLSEAQ